MCVCVLFKKNFFRCTKMDGIEMNRMNEKGSVNENTNANQIRATVEIVTILKNEFIQRFEF